MNTTMDSNMDTSLQLSPAVASLLSMGMPMASAPAAGVQAPGGKLPSYAAGGMVGVGGQPEPMGMAPGMGAGMGAGMPPGAAGMSQESQAGQPMDPQMAQMQLNQFASQNPQQMAQIRQAIVQEMQSGELTPQELNMIVQLATVASQNPEMYPNVRRFAIQQGIATEQDLPAEYDQGLVFVLLLAAKAVQQDLGGAPMGEAPASAGPLIPSMKNGGSVRRSDDDEDEYDNNGSKPVIIEAHTGEYVIPKFAVEWYGKQKLDQMVAKAKEAGQSKPGLKA